MKRDPVKSSNLQSVGYDKATQTLEIAFHSGSVYAYQKVLEPIYKQLMRAPSLGTFFSKVIKGQYKYTRIV